jgi:hypothetical protein
VEAVGTAHLAATAESLGAHEASAAPLLRLVSAAGASWALLVAVAIGTSELTSGASVANFVASAFVLEVLSSIACDLRNWRRVLASGHFQAKRTIGAQLGVQGEGPSVVLHGVACAGARLIEAITQASGALGRSNCRAPCHAVGNAACWWSFAIVSASSVVVVIVHGHHN